MKSLSKNKLLATARVIPMNKDYSLKQFLGRPLIGFLVGGFSFFPTFADVTRILAIDYGTKRVGLAVTDPLQIIATGLDTVPTNEIFDYLKSYLFTESVSKFVVGFPMHLDGSPAQLAPTIEKFVEKLNKLYPEIEVVYEDERFTSEDAKRIILQSGAKKKKRRDKALVDKVAAVLILQSYMERGR